MKLIFHQNYLLYLCDQGRHRKFSSCREFFDGRFFDLWSLHQCLDCPKFPRRATFLFCSISKLVFLSHYKFEFLHQELILKHNTCRGVLRWKTVDFVEVENHWFCSLHQSPDSPKFPESLSSIIFLDIQTHPPLSPITTSFISSIKVSIKSFLVVKTFSMVIFSNLFLALEHWPSDIPNNANYTVSSRYWNSQVSVTRGWVSSILVSAESLKFVEIYWQIKPLIFFSASEFW